MLQCVSSDVHSEDFLSGFMQVLIGTEWIDIAAISERRRFIRAVSFFL